MRLVAILCEEKIPFSQVSEVDPTATPPAPEVPENAEREGEKVPEQPEGERQITFFGLAAHLVVSFVAKVLRQYPIIRKTPLLQRTLTHRQSVNYSLPQAGMTY